jgi:sugar phosphate isomerase/epimerase
MREAGGRSRCERSDDLMFPNLSPGAIGIRATIEETVSLAKATGFKGVDLDLGQAESYGVARMRSLLAENALVIGGWGLPVDYQGEEQKFKETLGRLPHWASLARDLGCTRFATWMLPGSNEVTFEENFARMSRRFREICLVLKDHGCRLGVEFIGPKTLRARFKHEFIWNLPGMLKLCSAVGTGNMGILLDCWHWYTSGGDIAQITGLRSDQVVYVHVNDAPAGIERDQQVDNVRAMPMETGVIDLPGFLRALHEIGYDGPVTCEPFDKRLAEMRPLEAAMATAAAMQKAWKAAGLPW